MVPSGHSGTEFLGGIPLIPEEEGEEGSWVGCQGQAACWGAEGCWGLVGQGGTEEAAWSDGRTHRDRVFPTTCLPIFGPPPLIGCIVILKTALFLVCNDVDFSLFTPNPSSRCLHLTNPPDVTVTLE